MDVSSVTPDPTSPQAHRFSVVIPVFNSEAIVGETVDRTVAFFEQQGLEFEVILVNDGSHDRSWSIISSLAETNKNIVAINLLRNYGQHNALLCGLRHATGDFAITLDDDGQNPPEEIAHLIREVLDGHDLVFGEFAVKKAPFGRRLGSKAIGMINRRIFGQPKDLVVSNFRIMRRDVVDRICSSRTAYPYITGLALLNSRHRANVVVQHAPRAAGKSTYSITRIGRLVMTILFSYSSFPLRLSAALGAIVALGSFVVGGVFLILGATGSTQVPGWTSVVVLLALLNGVTIMMLSMLGEYAIRILNLVSNGETYHVVDVVAVGREP